MVADYKHIMYGTGGEALLRTGDIIRLENEDFKTFVRHDSFLSVLSQFESDENYQTKLWAVLNQPCDMVHDSESGRTFKSNLFLCPLLGLKSVLRKGALGDLVHYESVKAPEKAFTESYKSYLASKARRENEKKPDETHEVYGRRLSSEIVEPALSRIEELLETVKGQFHDPQDVLSALKDFLSSEVNLVQSFDEFEQDGVWKKAVSRYQEVLTEAEKKNNSLVLKADAKGKLASLCLNQLDSQGVFFYEPHPVISDSKADLSYIVLLQDMLTIKVKKESQSSGQLYSLLKTKRVLSLTENFSDRLLNIMGNYFSKIGTGDVRADKIIELYTNSYSGHFFTSEEHYQDFHKRNPPKTAEAVKAEAAT